MSMQTGRLGKLIVMYLQADHLMGTTGRQTKEKLNVGSPNFCIRGPIKNLSLDRSKLLVLNDQHLVVVA